MIGQHHIIVESPRLKYEFSIKRFITLIQGDSATGKTTLIDLLREYNRSGKSGPVKVESDVPCVAFDGSESDWSVFLSNKNGNIIFIDEGFEFIRTKEFAQSIKYSDNYFVLITRESLPCLPYSINEIYGIRTTGKYHFPQKIFHEFYPIIENSFCALENTSPTIVTEDSKAGFIFIKNAFNNSNCISANGNSNIYRIIKELSRKTPAIIVADGAAFGAFVEKLVEFAKYQKNISIYLPESFEWLVLKSGLIKADNLDSILENPEKYADTVKYFSWEQFFTDFLESETQNSPKKKYNKDSLSNYYLESKNKEKILSVFPLEFVNYLREKH